MQMFNSWYSENTSRDTPFKIIRNKNTLVQSMIVFQVYIFVYIHLCYEQGGAVNK